MAAVAVCIEVAVIAIAGLIYFTIQDRKEEKRKTAQHWRATLQHTKDPPLGIHDECLRGGFLCPRGGQLSSPIRGNYDNGKK